MLTIVSTNPVLDNDVYVESMILGQDINPSKSSFEVGGKAINVARVCKLLGESHQIVGLIAGVAGALIRQRLTDEGIVNHLIEVAGSSRICTNIIELSTHRQTCIHQHERFSVVQGKHEIFMQAYKRCLVSSSACVITGSLPHSLPMEFFANLIDLAHMQSVPCFLDTSGSALGAALAARPDVVKINRSEASVFAGFQIHSYLQALSACRKLVEAGAALAIITLGEEGAVSLEAECGDAYCILGPQFPTAHTSGCGDAFLAGLVSSWIHGNTRLDNYRRAMALALAAALQEKPGVIAIQDAERFLNEVLITSLV